MSNTDKLKKKAAEYENRKQYDKALELYEQVLNHTRAGEEDRDVPLYNRVGDLHYRVGNNEQAIGYYEKAADLYAEGGFFNNAIALCNKILRYSPGRTIIYYKLGIISAKKGFNSDAKQNFLEYADRMQRAGKMDEAFRALKEFADLCPGQDDVRLMLAEQLARVDRKPEALEQLQMLYDTLEAEGRTVEASAAVERMKALDPTFLPKRSATPLQRKKEGLVFLDLDFETGSPPKSEPMPAAKTPDAAEPVELPAAVSGEAADEVPEGFIEATAPDAPEGLELTSLAAESGQDQPVEHVQELLFLVPDAGDESDREGDSGIAEIELAPMIDTVDFPEEDVSPEAAVTISSNREAAASTTDDDFVDLGDWLERNRTPPSTRMVTHDDEPENDEQKDFGEMLDKFKEGISRNVDEADFESHYDLGIAFREMGLLDEAIGCFQKASRGEAQRVRSSEAMGQCFIDKNEPGVAMTVLERLTGDSKMNDSQLVGVLYLLGSASESLGRPADAAAYYQRVIAVHIGFRDAGERLAALAQTSP